MFLKQRQGAVNCREHAAPVDIRDQNNRALRQFRHPHVDDIAVAQIDFRGAPRPFQHHHLILCRQALVDLAHRFTQPGFVVVIADGIHIAGDFAHQHNLRPAIAGWLKQNWVHAHVGSNARRLGLKNLGSAHLFAIGCDTGVERHIL